MSGTSDTLRPKKSLGQHFFTNKTLAQKIARIVLEAEPNEIMEIGPGTGVFTNLLNKGFNKPLSVIETDSKLAKLLKFNIPTLNIIESDFLELDLESDDLGINFPVTCYGSLPYNISKLIIRKCLHNIEKFENLFFIIQKEVAQKYVVNPKESSVLSLTSSLYVDTKVLLNISPGSFYPVPKVMSSLIHFKPKPATQEFSKDELIKIEDFIFQSFRSPRKMLSKRFSKEQISKITDSNLQDFMKKRPAALSLDDFLSLYKSTKS